MTGDKGGATGGKTYPRLGPGTKTHVGGLPKKLEQSGHPAG